MPGGYKNIRPSDNPKPFDKFPENIGGKPKKIYTILKEKGYSPSDIKTAFGELAFYTHAEIVEVCKDKSKPIIMRIVANQFHLALQKGDWTRIREILEHVIGKAPSIVGIVDDEEKVKQIFKIGDQTFEF